MTMSKSAPAASVRWKSVALPTEHGGWGFLLEPIVLGLLVAPSAAGLLIGIGLFGAFMLRHPLKLVIGDRRRGKRFARTPLAERFALLYGLVAAGALALAALAGPLLALLPLALAAPLLLLTLVYDLRGDSRAAVSEVAGPVGLAAAASSIALAGGWPPPLALALWALIAARAAPSVLYVRARLRLEKGQIATPALPLLASAAALAVVLLLHARALAPLLAAAALLILLLRAALGLSRWRQPAAAKTIGFREIAFGALTVALAALGCARGW